MKRLSFIISLCISLFGILIVQNLFAKDMNLGLIGLTFVTPFILLSLFITYRFILMTLQERNGKLSKFPFILVNFILLLFLSYFSYQYKLQVIKTDDFFPPLNEKTYQVYMNFYTFALIHTISAFLGSIFGYVKNKNLQ